MKLKTTLLAALACTMSFASAASVSVLNQKADNSYFAIIGDSGASPIVFNTGANIMIGYYNTEPTTAADVLSTFNQLGTAIDFFDGAPGYFTGGFNTGTLNAGNPAIGKSVFVVVEYLGEVLAWKASGNPAGDVFTEDNPIGGPDTVQMIPEYGTLVIGGTADFNIGLGPQSGYTTVPVPEPSAALLGLAGSLLLLRRRR